LLMDYKDVIVHIFSRDMRDYYGLERIWSDATLINF
jgi:ribosome-associated protein